MKPTDIVAERPLLVQGSWPVDDVRRIFVEGAKWWEYHSRGFTMWPSDRNLAEVEADKRFPNGIVPPRRVLDTTEPSPTEPVACVKCGHSSVNSTGECRRCIDWQKHVCVFPAPEAGELTVESALAELREMFPSGVRRVTQWTRSDSDLQHWSVKISSDHQHAHSIAMEAEGYSLEEAMAQVRRCGRSHGNEMTTQVRICDHCDPPASALSTPEAERCSFCEHLATDHARGQMRRTEPCEAPDCECGNYQAATPNTQQRASQWQPIETAPKDGTRIVLARGDYVWIDSWWQGSTDAGWGDLVSWKQATGKTPEQPTHWQALPEPPNFTPAEVEGDDNA